MKKLKVDYKKRWGTDGTVYDQTITLNKDFIKYINKNIKYYHNATDEVKEIITKNIGFSKYYDCYLEELDTTKNINYLYITQLQFIYYYLSINNYDVKRVKLRNTIIKTA
jgi:hypothetical protein